MNQTIPFNRDHVVTPGQLETLRPGLRRITANNASPFTLAGTGTLVIGNGRVAVIDPGPDDPLHIHALVKALGDEVITHILVTHTHRDHSPGCRLLKELTGAPTYGISAVRRQPDPPSEEVEPQERGAAGSTTARTIDDADDHDFIPDFEIQDETVITGYDWELECLRTPGHASNHVCFTEAATRSLFSGDHVMAWSTTVILHPDGSMKDYLQSLDSLLLRDETIYWPAHGGPVSEPQIFVEQLVKHRLERGQQVVQAVSKGFDTVPDLVGVVYPDLNPKLRRGAMHSLLSTVVYLADTGQLSRENELSFESRLSLP